MDRGTISGSNVNNVSITCVSANSVGGTVSGLGKGQSVVLQNSATDSLTVSANGDFTFATKVSTSSAYAVTIKTQPLGLSCSVTNGSGYVATTNITNVAVACIAAPVTMPTLADYGDIPVDGKKYRYSLEQTGSDDPSRELIIYPNGVVNFLQLDYPNVADFFDDKSKVYANVPCPIFPLYVGKSGRCERSYRTLDAGAALTGPVGTDIQNWSVDSVETVMVAGKNYQAFKIVTDDINTINGNWTQYAYYAPELKNYVKIVNQKNDGSLLVNISMISIP